MAKKKRTRAKRGDTTSVPAALPAPSVPSQAGSSETVSDRDAGGKFVAGQSGNPAGRVKGSKNLITQERLALETALRSYIGDENNLPKVKAAIDRLLEITATAEDKVAVTAMKVLFDKVLVTPKETEDPGTGPRTFKLIIDNQTVQGSAPVGVVIEDAEYDEVKND